MKRGQKHTRRQKRRDAQWVRARITRDRAEYARAVIAQIESQRSWPLPPSLRWLALYE
jgi:hypothetical protein